MIMTQTTSLHDAIIDLWHISRTALATQSSSRYDRMLYVKKELSRSYPSLIIGYSGKALWFAIEDAIN